MLIDYEVAMWNPELYDLAAYLNELSCDYSHPDKACCIKYYHENRPSKEEVKMLTMAYLDLKRTTCLPQDSGDKSGNDDETCSNEVENAVDEVKRCMVLHNFFCGLCPILMMFEADETDPGAFQWEYIRGRCH